MDVTHKARFSVNTSDFARPVPHVRNSSWFRFLCSIRAESPSAAGARLCSYERPQLAVSKRLLRKRGAALSVFLLPVRSVDPEYVEFRKPWPPVRIVGTMSATRMARTTRHCARQGRCPSRQPASSSRGHSRHLSNRGNNLSGIIVLFASSWRNPPAVLLRFIVGCLRE